MEEDKEYTLDLWETLLRNIPMAPFFVLIIAYVMGFTRFMKELEGESTQLLAVIIFAFSFVKLVAWIGHPTITLKHR